MSQHFPIPPGAAHDYFRLLRGAVVFHHLGSPPMVGVGVPLPSWSVGPSR